MALATRRVGRYEVVGELGRGGVAIVYRARQNDLDRQVALKELASFHARDPALAERFSREARVAASLSHPNIVTVFDFFEHDGLPYIAMELVPGGSLRPRIGQLSLAQIAGVLEGVLSALSQGESRGVIHRDVKPENVLVTDVGSIKLSDFGIAKAYNAVWTAQFRTVTGTTVGTPTYMAPEQAAGKGVGPWTDLYALGVVAYELLAGQPPFDDGAEPMAVLMHHLNDPVPPLLSLAPQVDPRLAAWTEHMLAKVPGRRPDSALAAWEELEEIVVSLLGPLWRRDARLLGGKRAAQDPLGPARFEETSPPRMSTPSTPTMPASPDRPAEAPSSPDLAARPTRRRVAVAGSAVLVALAAGALGLAAVLGAISGSEKAARRAASRPDPHVVASIPVGGAPNRVAVGNGFIWASVVGAKHASVKKIDPIGNKVAQTISVRGRPDGLAVGQKGGVWVGDVDGDTVTLLRLNQQYVARVERAPEGIALDPRNVWVANRNSGTVSRLVRGSPTAPAHSVDVGVWPVDVFAGKKAIWVTNDGSGTLSRIDPVSGRRVPPDVRVGNYPRGVVEAYGSVWVANSLDDTVTQLKFPSHGSGRPTRKDIPVGHEPREIAAGEGYIWVANDGSDTVSRINPRSASVVGRPTRVGNSPVSIAVFGGAVWVANRGSGTISHIRP